MMYKNIFIVLSVILFYSCNNPNLFDDNLLNEIDKTCEDNNCFRDTLIFDFESIVDFDWDKAFFFYEHMGDGLIEEILGEYGIKFKYPNNIFGLLYDERRKFIFIYKDRVTKISYMSKGNLWASFKFLDSVNEEYEIMEHKEALFLLSKKEFLDGSYKLNLKQINVRHDKTEN